MSLVKTIPNFTTSFGTINKETGEITISAAWYKFLMNQYLRTVGSGIGTAEADILATSDMDLINSLGANGHTGSATAAFSATNKPGSNAGVVGWIPIDVNGVIRYLAVWG